MGGKYLQTNKSNAGILRNHDEDTYGVLQVLYFLILHCGSSKKIIMSCHNRVTA
jgi:hypothetical protein